MGFLQKYGEYPYIENEQPLLPIISPPYPYSFMRQAAGEYPHVEGLPELLPIISPPYMYSFMIQSEGRYPTIHSLPEIIEMGAFCHAKKLNSVTIPSSVHSIGRHSFSYTALKNVKLPENCTYYETSFPDGCTVSGGTLLTDNNKEG